MSPCRMPYISVKEALFHAGLHHNTMVKINLIQAEDLEAGSPQELLKVDGIRVPGGFGDRGIEGKIKAVEMARWNKIPFLGLCLGMQCAIIEFARNVAGLTGAHSVEFYPETPHPVIDMLPGQNQNTPMGGSLRLGAYDCKVQPDTLAYRAYNREQIRRGIVTVTGFNSSYRETLAEKGLVLSGINEEDGLVEIIELKDHPWFVACQFHPEYKSRPGNPHPLFRDFIGSALRGKHG